MSGRKILSRVLLAMVAAGALLGLAILAFLGPWARRPRLQDFPPLHQAARDGDLKAVTVLLGAGTDPEALDQGPNGWTPLLHAIHKDQLSTVELLLTRGADPNRLAANGTSALNLAASEGNLAIVRALIAAGARVEGHSGTAAVLNAATGGHTEMVRTLLAANPRLRINRGPRTWVALLLARLRGDRALLALLARTEARS